LIEESQAMNIQYEDAINTKVGLESQVIVLEDLLLTLDDPVIVPEIEAKLGEI
jgi:hypothetical protein